jgi:biopolymer transport protein ExbB
LLGLLGTVTGLMRAFLNVGNAELSVVAVTGGIGEALIATACGLGIAIISLVPFNYFTKRVTRLQFELETAATNVEVMLHAVKLNGVNLPPAAPPAAVGNPPR